MVMREQKKQNDSGIGLIEVTIALLIFMIGLIVLAQSLTLAVALNRKNRENLIVTTLCKDKIEQLISLDFEDITTNTTLPPQKQTDGSFGLVYPQDGKGLSDGGSIAPTAPSDDPPGKFYRDYIDTVGNRVSPAGIFYTRQWSIETNGEMKTIRVTVMGPPSFGLVNQSSMIAFKSKSE
jgi:type II secretory pathway pseudopilin PulG